MNSEEKNIEDTRFIDGLEGNLNHNSDDDFEYNLEEIYKKLHSILMTLRD